MIDTDNFYTTKLLIEVEVSHQFDPMDAINIVTGLLTVPAIKKVEIVNAITNFVLHGNPTDEFVGVDLSGNYDIWNINTKARAKR